MRTKILVLMIMTLMSLSLKSQQLQLLNDTNVILFDYNPDTVLYGSFTQHDSLRIDFNLDGVNDFKFYYVPYSGGAYPYVGILNSNCQFSYFIPTNNDSLNNPSITWRSKNTFWNITMEPDQFFGIKLSLENYDYYGWVHAMGGTANAITMTIDKYAFCKIPNYPFHVGQTKIVTHVPIVTTPDSTNVYLNGSGTGIVVQSGKIIQAVSITSPTGAVVTTQSNINADSATISTKGLAHGAYILQVQFLDKSICTKQIVL